MLHSVDYEKNEELLNSCFVDEKNRLRSSVDLNAIGINQTLNNPVNVEIAKKIPRRNDILEMHGIRVAHGDSNISTEYIVSVFQTDVPLIYKSHDNGVWLQNSREKKFVLLSPFKNHKEVRKVKRIAMRAIYSLGLDYGIVRCGISEGSNISVLGIYLESRLSGQMLDGLKSACREYLESLVENKFLSFKEIVLGCDLEFVMKDRAGKLLLASDYFPRYGIVGCDNVSLNPDNTKKKPVGEFRPDPTSSPEVLTDSIFLCLLRAMQKTKQQSVRFLAGNMPLPNFPIGGHIHFSGIVPNFKMLRALDNYLALPLLLLEDPKGMKRRPTYGFLGDFRYKPHGGFEYRTLPSWMVSPVIARGVLALSKIIIFNHQDLHQVPLNSRYMQKAYYYGDKKLIRPWLDQLWRDLSKCEGYDIYQESMTGLYKCLQSEQEWSEDVDISTEWHEYYKERP